MNLKTLMKKTQFNLSKKSPELFLLGTILATTGAIVFSAIAGSKTNDILEPANEEIKKLNENRVIINNENGEVVDVTKKEITKVKVKTLGKLAELYMPVAILYGIGCGTMLSSHEIMKGRQLALSSALVTTTEAFNAYRNRVKDTLGADAEKDLYLNGKTVSKEFVNEATGEVETKEIKEYSPDGYSIMFDASCKSWENNSRMNFEYLSRLTKQLNVDLKSNGFVTLMDVYKALGVDYGTIDKRKLQAAQIVGWLWDPYDDSRDSFITLGIIDENGYPTDDGKLLFDGYTKDIWLTFNVDGDIVTGNIDPRTGKPRKTFMETIK